MRFATVLALLAIAVQASAQPVFWPTNGHYYEWLGPTSGITWVDANTAASASTYNGLPGHLVTFSSDAEFNFVYHQFPHNFVWIGFTDRMEEGNFLWVTGEPVTFTGWLYGEPNNSAQNPPGEDYAWYENRNGVWGWNDYIDVVKPIGLSTPLSYVVEYESVPEPTSSLLTLGMIGIAWGNRSTRYRYSARPQ